ncbi:uncharacterized protein LOC111327889 isoform X1 [Stylophora pistillata]|uniref:uncharacterized protein LOC111327889 isoform X1 n=1 Tax=Stylophora pistillata TaxID=50429 RepID=UPI000C0450C2|nr:uncharacterized protein LOC111327889 isoform X1 [Stylophora pistillata]
MCKGLSILAEFFFLRGYFLLKVLDLNDYDKLYLLMCKWRIIRLFNPLCYAADVTSVEDLEKKVRTNLHDLKRKLPAWSQSEYFKDDLETIEKVIEDSKTVNYEDLPSLLGIKRNNYREDLEDAGVQMIQKKHLSLQRKIALGRPYSGDVYTAQWSQGHNTVDVVLRFDFGPAQRELFIREAKIMTCLSHEYIMKFYGAVILGSYADSVGLAVEFFSKGNLEEFRVPSLFHAWLYASQLSSALKYLESKHLVHTSVAEPFVYISSLEKISLGGFMCCYYEEEIKETKQKGQHGNLLLSTITGHQGHRLDDLSGRGVVALLSHVVLSMFRYLDSHCLSQLVNLFPDRKEHPLVCPSGVSSLLERCQEEDLSKRPTFHDIVQTLAKERPAKFCFTTSNSSTEPCELSYDQGENVWVISQDTSRYHGMWFGQKEKGAAGFFESEKVIRTDDDNQVPHEIRARGIEAQLAYNIALLEGKVKVCRARLLIIGQDRAGKTSLKNSLMGLPFNPNEPSTEGLEVNSSKLEVNVEQLVEWKAVSEEHKDVEQASLQKRCIARLVASQMLEKKETKASQTLPPEEKEMLDEKDVAQEQLNGLHFTANPPASNLTQEPRKVFAQDLVNGSREKPTPKPKIDMPDELTPLVTECLKSPEKIDGNSATETVLDIWDFAGQHLYYATHPIFFCHRAIYLLVHNLEKKPNDLAEPSFKHGDHVVPLKNTSNETNLDMLLSWLVSVHSICRPPVEHDVKELCKSSLRCLPPPVLMVGTHADKVSTQEIKQVESEISKSLKGKTYQEHVLSPFYKVDNRQSSKSREVQQIQAKVQQILSSGLISTADLPVKWFNFEKALKSRTEGGTFFLTLEEIHTVAQEECYIEDNEQLDTMLNYFHDLGLIVRFTDIVVLNTQWLVNLFKKLISTCHFEEQDPVDRKLWEELEETGVLQKELIDKVFEDLEEGRYKSLQQSVLEMMEKYSFVAKFQHQIEPDQQQNISCEGKIVKYFVPAQLRLSDSALQKLVPQEGDPCALIYKFCDGFVPHGLFPQLLSRLIARCPILECTTPPKLYCDAARFILGKRGQYDLVLLCSKHYIKVVLRGYNLNMSSNSLENGKSMACQVRILIDGELRSLSEQWQWLRNVRYKVCVTCSACKSSDVLCKRHQSATCLDQDCLHFLPISSEVVDPSTPFICPEQVGNHSRFTVSNLHLWYCSIEVR